MNRESSFKKLEEILKQKQPLLYNQLQPGLSDKKIDSILRKAGFTKWPKALEDLYSWKNGGVHRLDQLPEDKAFIYNDIYQFLDLSLAVIDSKQMDEVAKHFEHLQKVAGKAFPFLWDGVTSYIAFNLESDDDELWYIEFEDPDVPRSIGSFDEFIASVIESWENEEGLVIESRLW